MKFNLLVCILICLLNKMTFSFKINSLSNSITQVKKANILALKSSSLSIIHPIIKTTGVTLFISLQITQIQTALSLLKSKTCKSLSIVPFIAMYTNCYVWFIYGLLKQDFILIYPNLTGIIAGLFSAISYQYVSIVMDKKPISTNFITILLSFAIITLVSYLSNSSYRSMIGLIGCIMSIILSGSPLAVMKKVLNEKNTSSIIFSSSLIMFINSFCWFLYGMFIKPDLNISVPNFIGFILSCMQMLLFLLYPNQKKM